MLGQRQEGRQKHHSRPDQPGLALLRRLQPSWTCFQRSGLPEFSPLRFAGGQPLSEMELKLAE